MGLQQFTNKVLDGVKQFLGSEVDVSVRDVQKNNGVIMKGLTISDCYSNLSPTIYLDSFYEQYQNGKTLGEIVRSVIGVYEETRIENNVDMRFFTDYRKTAKRIFCKLINYEKNKELLEDVPHKKCLDLAVVCYYAYVSDIVGNGTITIRNSHLQNWCISEERLFREAMENTEKVLKYKWYDMHAMMKEILKENLREKIVRFPIPDDIEWPESWTDQVAEQIVDGMLEEEKDSPMYVVTNCNKFLGAVCMLFDSVLEEMGEMLGSDFMILPSSIHEVIMVPVGETGEIEHLKDLVSEVNRTQVEPHEVLSDAVYYYDRKKQKLILL